MVKWEEDPDLYDMSMMVIVNRWMNVYDNDYIVGWILIWDVIELNVVMNGWCDRMKWLWVIVGT